MLDVNMGTEKDNELFDLMLRYIFKEKNMILSDYLFERVLDDFQHTKGYRKGVPFYCLETNEVFASGKESCERFGITMNELNIALHDGICVNGHTFKFIL